MDHGCRAPLLDGWDGSRLPWGIPVIDQYDYIIRQGGRAGDARWPHNLHWSPTGHQWAAEALLEYLEQHPETCGGAVAGETH